MNLEPYLKDGWTIVSDGPSGVQLSRKRWKGQSKGAVILGAILLILFWPLGLLLIVLGVIDGAMAKPESKFLSRQ